MAAERAPGIGDLVRSGRRSISFEFFPPKTPEAEETLWASIRAVEALHPTFVSITYGAGGSNRDGTIRVTERVATQTSLTPLGHLTCVGHSIDELRGVIGGYAGAGVRNILALRGDPPGGPTKPWVAHPEGLDHAVDLVRLTRELGDFCVGVAAFPDTHPEAPDADVDARRLVAKAEAGAEFAITQMFFTAAAYTALVERVRALGCDLPIVPGVMPVTSLPQIARMAELMQMPLPDRVVDRLAAADDGAGGVRAAGVEIATELCEELLAAGAPGLHFITLNRSSATTEVFGNLGLVDELVPVADASGAVG